MIACDYYDVLQGAADLAGLDRDKISVTDAAVLRGFISMRLRTAWEFQKWPELCLLEKRTFRLPYSGASLYVAGNEVYFPPTQTYYLCLTATTGNAPADSLGNTDLTRWAVCQSVYAAPAYDNTAAYVAGNQVYDPATDGFYQAIASSSGAGVGDVTKFGLLVAFDRYVSKDQSGATPIGTVFGVWNLNKRLRGDAREVCWSTSERGIQVLTCVPFVWVEFRLRAPVLSGAKFAVGNVYAAGNQVFYRSAAVAGNFYTANQATSAGESPETTPAKWDVVQVPGMFRSYLEYGAASDFLMPQGEDEAGPKRALADAALADQAAVLLGQEGQVQRTECCTR